MSNPENKIQIKPIPFITFDTSTKKFTISKEAKKIICNPN